MPSYHIFIPVFATIFILTAMPRFDSRKAQLLSSICRRLGPDESSPSHFRLSCAGPPSNRTGSRDSVLPIVCTCPLHRVRDDSSAGTAVQHFWAWPWLPWLAFVGAFLLTRRSKPARALLGLAVIACDAPGLAARNSTTICVALVLHYSTLHFLHRHRARRVAWALTWLLVWAVLTSTRLSLPEGQYVARLRLARFALPYLALRIALYTFTVFPAASTHHSCHFCGQARAHEPLPFIDYAAYMLYMPLVSAGPLACSRQWSTPQRGPADVHGAVRLFLHVLAVAAAATILRVLVPAYSMLNALPSYSLLELFFAAFFIIFDKWSTGFVVWNLGTAVALLDGVNVVRNTQGFILSLSSIQLLWRRFHATFRLCSLETIVYPLRELFGPQPVTPTVVFIFSAFWNRYISLSIKSVQSLALPFGNAAMLHMPKPTSALASFLHMVACFLVASLFVIRDDVIFERVVYAVESPTLADSTFMFVCLVAAFVSIK